MEPITTRSAFACFPNLSYRTSVRYKKAVVQHGNTSLSCALRSTGRTPFMHAFIAKPLSPDVPLDSDIFARSFALPVCFANSYSILSFCSGDYVYTESIALVIVLPSHTPQLSVFCAKNTLDHRRRISDLLSVILTLHPRNSGTWQINRFSLALLCTGGWLSCPVRPRSCTRHYYYGYRGHFLIDSVLSSQRFNTSLQFRILKIMTKDRMKERIV